MELVNKIGVDRQITDEWMVVSEGEDFLFSLLADQPSEIFKSVGAGLKRLQTGGIDRARRVVLDETAQAHNGTQRFGSPRVKSALSPESAFLTQNRGSTNPITTGTDDWGVQTPRTQNMAKLTRFDPGMDLNLFHPLIEDSYAATVPAHPDLVADKFSGNFIKGACDFDVTVAMNVAPGFLEAGKKRIGQRLQIARSSSKQVATCLRVVPWIRLSATWLSHCLRKRFSSLSDLNRRPLSALART